MSDTNLGTIVLLDVRFCVGFHFCQGLLCSLSLGIVCSNLVPDFLKFLLQGLLKLFYFLSAVAMLL